VTNYCIRTAFLLGGQSVLQHLFNLSALHRDDVAALLKRLDPLSVENRRRKRFVRRVFYTRGPNDLWSADGHDKIKQFGFPLHGCIDAYSRKMIWLRLEVTNNDPDVVGGFFLVRITTASALNLL